MAPRTGLEPVTRAYRMRYSAKRGDVSYPTQLAERYSKTNPEWQIHSQFARRTMTFNLMSQGSRHATVREQRKKQSFSELLYGSPNWARTSDIMINSHALYRLSYRGIPLVHLQGLEPWTH